MSSFTRADLLEFYDATVPDLVGKRPRLVFVGINPGLWTAATQTHFSHPGNRFYPALFLAGITGHEVDRKAGFTAKDRTHLTGRGLAITNLVPRATARADELSREELRAGGASVAERIAGWKPEVVAFVGITAYRVAFGQPKAQQGLQDGHVIGQAEVWAVGNPSGLNAHESVDSLARTYREIAERAGVTLDPPRW